MRSSAVNTAMLQACRYCSQSLSKTIAESTPYHRHTSSLGRCYGLAVPYELPLGRIFVRACLDCACEQISRQTDRQTVGFFLLTFNVNDHDYNFPQPDQRLELVFLDCDEFSKVEAQQKVITIRVGLLDLQ
jgi:hypothetical protein